MSLTAYNPDNNRSKNYCICGAVQPFDACRKYSSPCSPDASVKDGWFLCEFHASIRFKIEKMVLPIPDGVGTIFYRTVGKSLVSENAEGMNRILIPTAANYQQVLNIESMSLPEQLIFHMIYNNVPEQARVCNALRFNESFESDIYKIVDSIYTKTSAILSMTDSTRYCSLVDTTSTRVYFSGDNAVNNVARNTMEQMPGFLKNLINACVAPQNLILHTKNIQLRENPTCTIDETGLVASARLYNPVQPRYRTGYKRDLLTIENTLIITGSDAALHKSMARYEPYPVVVPLMLGVETKMTTHNMQPLPPRNVLPIPNFERAAAAVAEQQRAEQRIAEAVAAAAAAAAVPEAGPAGV
ncbi:VP39 [Alphabaculovirus myunipunctae]|uniref:VP39 n=1 Tax=Mythimna unipuncta nucleopolyhedrovirus TaxID=447897 RepID=A0A2K9VSD2_9ABAC|nr:VP39 [Mythimna unipuncta nucleopolyhedrovirus]AUV65354.1 VP39 [Mythimna unipuncta nucleopolyhedrovirus]